MDRGEREVTGQVMVLREKGDENSLLHFVDERGWRFSGEATGVERCH